jgi:hypothetical protein
MARPRYVGPGQWACPQNLWVSWLNEKHVLSQVPMSFGVKPELFSLKFETPTNHMDGTKPRFHRLRLVERYARVGSVVMIVASAAVLGIQFYNLLIATDRARAQAEVAWREASPQRARLAELVSVCNRGRASDGDVGPVLSVDGCDNWVVQQAERLWKVDARADMLALGEARFRESETLRRSRVTSVAVVPSVG